MFYFFPLVLLMMVLAGVGLFVSSPLIYSFWLSGLTAVMVFLFLMEGQMVGGSLLYLVEESLAALILLSWLFGGGSIFLLLFLLVKGALAPFHKWLVEVLSSSGSESFVWGLTVHKAPFVFLMGSVVLSWEGAWFLFSLGVGVFVMFKLGETRSLLILSSSNTVVLVLLFLFFEFLGALFFFFCYVGIFWSSWVLGSASVDSIFLLLGMGGVPPFLFFQLKWVVFSLYFGSGETWVFFFAVVSGIASLVYIRFVVLMDLALRVWGGLVFLGLWGSVSLFLPVW